MARNVTQKDQTLNEIIDWCEQLPPTRTVCTFSASNSTMPEKCTD